MIAALKVAGMFGAVAAVIVVGWLALIFGVAAFIEWAVS